MPRILCVDDEPHVLSALKRQLRRRYEVVTTDTPDHAIDLLEEQVFEVIVSDERMPGMSGHEFLATARKAAPDTVRILLTGKADATSVAAAINDSGIFRYLQKPWSEADLSEALEAATERFRTVVETRLEQEKTEEQNLRFAEYNRKLAQSASKAEAELSETVRTLKDAAQASVDTLAHLIEWSNPELAGHGARTEHLANAIAERMGLSAEDLDTIRWAARLHDVGKLFTGDSRSADPAVQFEHAVVGCRLIATIPFLGRSADMIKAHHERVDGRGFPDGLSKDDIPLGSRIIAAADAFDRLMHPDASQVPLSLSDAKEEVRKLVGKVLDGEVVGALIEEVTDKNWQPGESDVTVDVLKLEPGMSLARTLRTHDGKIVAGAGHVLQESDVERIMRLARRSSIPRRIALRRSPAAQTEESHDREE